MMRIGLLLLTNLAVMLVFIIILNLIGIQSSNIIKLAIISGFLGLGGSMMSLLMAKFIALRSIQGKIISKPCNEKEHWLMNVVSMQSKKVGIIMPEVAIYHANDINAFATGAKRDSALIAVSTGLLNNMTHDESEAVVAHEISHIANGDMITMTLIQGVVNTFVIFLSRILSNQISNFISSERNIDDDQNHRSLSYFFISMILELMFGILASIIILWFSRYREFYADAGSARLVGREKMIAALQRLKTSHEPQEPNNLIAFCIHGHNESFSSLFMSHPPLDKRIKALQLGTYLNSYYLI